MLHDMDRYKLKKSFIHSLRNSLANISESLLLAVQENLNFFLKRSAIEFLKSTWEQSATRDTNLKRAIWLT